MASASKSQAAFLLSLTVNSNFPLHLLTGFLWRAQMFYRPSIINLPRLFLFFSAFVVRNCLNLSFPFLPICWRFHLFYFLLFLYYSFYLDAMTGSLRRGRPKLTYEDQIERLRDKKEIIEIVFRVSKIFGEIGVILNWGLKKSWKKTPKYLNLSVTNENLKIWKASVCIVAGEVLSLCWSTDCVFPKFCKQPRDWINCVNPTVSVVNLKITATTKTTRIVFYHLFKDQTTKRLFTGLSLKLDRIQCWNCFVAIILTFSYVCLFLPCSTSPCFIN